MPNTIDNRTVEMNFNNASFAKGVNESLKSIDNLKKGLNFTDAAKGLGAIDKAASNVKLGAISDGIDAIRTRFSTMGIVGITVIQNITNRLIGMAEQLARTFIIDPVSTGLSEYETQINAIQTILANTSGKGTTLTEVTAALRLLNTYADQTIYNFTEMTRNIGTFTAAGVDLGTSVQAIKGIANLAAVSGSNSQQAATAMYQLSQALSSGTVKLMDWNSVVNAGMGGQVFQDALKDTARVHGLAIDQIIEQYGSFRESLSTGWITSEILTETLSKFTGDLTRAQLESMGYADDQIEAILKMGVTANDAATKVKTLTQLNDTLMEAAQSGWTQSWELIIGDFDEAKAFFTYLSDTLGAAIGHSADARNAILTDWKEARGRVALIGIVTNSLSILMNVARHIGDAMREIFPPISGKQLGRLSVQLFLLSMKFKMASENMEPLTRIAKGVFAALDILKMFLVSMGKAVLDFASGFSGAVPAVIEFLARIGDWVVGLRNAIKAGDVFNKFFKTFFDVVKPVLYTVVGLIASLVESIQNMGKINTTGVKKFTDKLVEKFEPLKGLQVILENIIGFLYKLVKAVSPVLSKVASIFGETFNSFLEGLTSGLNNFDPSNLLQIINGGLFAGILLATKNFIDEGTGLFGNFAEIFDNVIGTLEALQNNINSKTLLNIAAALAIMAVSLIGISMIDSHKLSAALGAMTVMFVQLFTSLKALSSTSAGLKSLPILTAGLIGISTAMLILSAAVVNLGRMDPQELGRGTSALAMMIVMMRLSVDTLSKSTKGAIAGALGLTIFAGALIIMAKAVRAFGQIDLDELKQGLLAMGVILLELGLFIKLSGGQKGMISMAVGLGILSLALLGFVGVMFLLGQIPMQQLIVGLAGIAGMLLVLSLGMQSMPKDMLLTGAGLVVVATALVILAGALRIMGNQSWDQLGIGLATLASVLAILSVALTTMNSSVLGSGALLVAAIAIGILAIALKSLGQMSMEEIGRSLLVVAGALAILGLAAYILTPVIPSLIGLGVAMALIGVGALALGAGILMLSIGLTALAAGGTVLVTGLVLMISAIVGLIPLIAKQLGVALITLIETIATGAPILLEAIVTLLLMLIEAVVKVIPPLVDAILLLVTTLLEKLVEKFPDIIEAGIELILAFLSGVRDNIGEVVRTAYDIMINFIEAIEEKIPDLVQAGWDLIIAYINALADGIDENMPRLIEASEKLGEAIVQGIIDGLNSMLDSLIGATIALAKAILDRFMGILNMHSPSKEMFIIGQYFVRGFIDGINDTAGNAISTVETFGNDILTQFSEMTSKIQDGINSNMEFDPSVRPVVDLSKVAEGAAMMHDILTGTPLNLATAVSRSGVIANSLRSGLIGSEQTTPKTGVSKEITFIQNNNSPKALSSIDIYRQTRNQLLKAKGYVGGDI